MSDLSNPHDRFFKETFARPEVAKDFMRHYLPEAVVALLDLGTLELRRDSFVDPDLRQHFSDMLYAVELRDGTEAFIYVLVEHKSYPDPWVAFQLLRYMVRIWEQHWRRGNRPTLVPILPLVQYHGRDEWRIATHFGALVPGPEALHPFVPDFTVHLVDVTALRPEAITGAVALRVALLMLQGIFSDAFPEHLAGAVRLLAEVTEKQTVLEMLEVVLRYTSLTHETVTEETLREVVDDAFRQ